MIIKAFTKLIERTRWLHSSSSMIAINGDETNYFPITTYTPKKIYNIYIFDEPLSY